jgi:tRNA (guanine-N7-)-methyltransferase
MEQRPYPATNYLGYRPSRNPYAEKYLLLPKDHAPTAFSCHDTEGFRGRWREFFGAKANQRIHLEVGCYHGESLVEMAERNPEEFFIGVEWKFREAYKAVEKSIKRNLKNLVFLRANVARLPWIFTPGEIDRAWILFPDPWPKTGQQKWRTLHADFFRSLALLLEPGKEVLVKTDDSDYAAFISRELRDANAFDPLPEELSIPIWQSFPPTPFEKIFFRNNAPTFSFSLARNANLIVPPAPVAKQFVFPIN